MTQSYISIPLSFPLIRNPFDTTRRTVLSIAISFIFIAVHFAVPTNFPCIPQTSAFAFCFFFSCWRYYKNGCFALDGCVFSRRRLIGWDVGFHRIKKKDTNEKLVRKEELTFSSCILDQEQIKQGREKTARKDLSRWMLVVMWQRLYQVFQDYDIKIFLTMDKKKRTMTKILDYTRYHM